MKIFLNRLSRGVDARIYIFKNDRPHVLLFNNTMCKLFQIAEEIFHKLKHALHEFHIVSTYPEEVAAAAAVEQYCSFSPSALVVCLPLLVLSQEVVELFSVEWIIFIQKMIIKGNDDFFIPK